MSYAALVSGIALAQVGLGVVHGLASPLGGYFPIPHSIACGTLLAAATEANIRALEAQAPGSLALDKYSKVGELLGGQKSTDPAEARSRLVQTLSAWTEELRFPRLGSYGVTEADVPRIVEACSQKTNPVELASEEIATILRQRL